MGCPVTYLHDLREHDNGDLAGKPLAEVPFPWELHPHEKFGETGESAIEFQARAEQVFSYIKKKSTPYNRIAIVSHGGIISGILESFLGISYNHDVFFKTEDTGIHFIEYTDQGRVVLHSNSYSHLQEESRP
ncbi:histidine phosphatase family protein [Radiobacillus deserti]|uniref:histidine phosphatase family protein n=1 Tax=Radiobacillus deserti TaxID=2594883 RepID=UPI00225DFEE8|nr:histidine phosphatase family protein [Radiobacillus deserti]